MFDDKFQLELEKYKKELIKFAEKNQIEIPEEEAVTASAMPKLDNNQYIDGIQDFVPMKEETGNEAKIPNEENYNTYQDYLNNNRKAGTLRVQAFVAGRAFPVSDVKITVSKKISGKDYTVAERITDKSGIASNIILPAPEGNLSETPPEKAPYATYDVLVEHPDYTTLLFKDVPVFDGIESIQPVEMRPLIGRENKTVVIFETEPEDLMKEEK